MFESLGDILKSGPVPADHDQKRTHQPVRRHSHMRGRCEGTFWRRTDRKEVARILLAAERYDLTGRGYGERNGPLGHIAIEVLKFLTNLVSFKTGRLDPSLEYLAAKLNRSKDSVVNALKALRAHGFLDWIRRYEPTGNEGRGPQVRQTSNAYRLSLPPRALQLLGRLGQSAPPPDDHTHRQATAAAEIEAHKATLTNAELALFELGDTPLGQALASLARSISERESRGQAESRSSSIS